MLCLYYCINIYEIQSVGVITRSKKNHLCIVILMSGHCSISFCKKKICVLELYAFKQLYCLTINESRNNINKSCANMNDTSQF